jgi:hypothetical protein
VKSYFLIFHIGQMCILCFLHFLASDWLYRMAVWGALNSALFFFLSISESSPTKGTSKERDDSMMDLPDEELKLPLVTPIDTQNNTLSGSAGSTRSVGSQGKGPSPRRTGLKPVEPQRIGGGGAPTGTHYVAMRTNGDDGGEEEEKESENRKFPYAAPNVHPYAVPQYEPNAYGGRGNAGWGGGGGHEGMFDQSRIPTIDIVFSGMYTLAAALTILEGFGMLIYSSFLGGT